MLSWLVLLWALSLLDAPLAHADRIHLKNDRVWEGRIVRQEPGYVVIETVGGPVKVSRRDIKRIEESKTTQELYKERVATLSADDAPGHYLLGLWCEKQGLHAQARYHLLYVIGLDPDHGGARKSLGHLKHEGKWMTEAEAKRASGLKLYKGRWMTAEAADEEAAADARKARANALARGVRKIARRIATARDFRERIDAEKTLYQLHDPLAFPAIVKLLGSERPEVRISALKAIKKLNVKGISGTLVRTALLDPVSEARDRAASLLTNQYNGQVRKVLIKALQSEHKQVRSSAAKILGNVKDPTTIAALIKGLYVTYRRRSGERPPILGLIGRITPAPGDQLRTVPLDQPIDSLNEFAINYDALESLKNMTGQDFGTSKRAWLEWWAENEDEFTIWNQKRK